VIELRSTGLVGIVFATVASSGLALQPWLMVDGWLLGSGGQDLAPSG